MADKQNELNHAEEVALFKKALDGMIAKSGKAWNESVNYFYSTRRFKEYTKEEIDKIINSNSLTAQ